MVFPVAALGGMNALWYRICEMIKTGSKRDGVLICTEGA